MIKLFIGGFPLAMTEMEVVQLVAPYADVVTVKLVRDRATRMCKGYGFLEVADETEALNAILALNETKLDDRVLSLNIVAEPPKPVHLKKTEKIKRPRRPRL